MFFKAVHHIWKSVFSVLWYRGLKSLIPDGPSLLWSSCSQAGWGIFHWEKKSWCLIGYCPGKVYWMNLHCRLWRISRNALTRVMGRYVRLNEMTVLRSKRDMLFSCSFFTWQPNVASNWVDCCLSYFTSFYILIVCFGGGFISLKFHLNWCISQTLHIFANFREAR